MKAEKVVFGLIIVFIGIIWFMVNIGILPATTARELWSYWPLALILWGLLLLFGRGSSITGCLSSILIFLLVVGALFMFFAPTHRITGGVSEMRFGTQAGEDVSLVRLDLTHRAGEFVLKSLSDFGQRESAVGTTLLQARLQTAPSPQTQRVMRDTVSEITIRDDHRSWPLKNQFSRWELWLADDIASEVILRTGATRADIDLSKLAVQDLQIKAGAGDITIRLGEYNTNITVESGAGNITLYVPADAGVRVSTSGALLSFSGDDARVFSIGEYRYESERLNEKAAIAEIEIKAGAGSVSVKQSK